MPTTTFCDIQFNEEVENYTYENKARSFSEGSVVSLPFHTANKFVNKWDKAEFASSTYEVRQEEYEDYVCRVKKEDDVAVCEVEMSDGEVCEREKPCPYHDDE